MTTNQAQRIILLSGATTIGGTFLGNALPADLGGKSNLPSARIWIGGMVAITALSLLAEAAPAPAAYLAVAMGFTATTLYVIPIAEKFFAEG